MGKKARTWLYKRITTWMLLCLFFCVYTGQAAMLPLVEGSVSRLLPAGETWEVAIPTVQPAHLQIQNQGIDTIATALDVRGNVISESASWRGREGKYILNLAGASKVSIISAERHAPLGKVQLTWINNNSTALDSLGLGGQYHLSGNSTGAINAYQRTVSALSGNDIAWLGDTYFELGILYQSTGQLSEAAIQFSQAISTYQAQLDTNGIAAAHNALGVTLRRQGKPILALQSYQTALQFRQVSNDHYYAAQTLNNIALLQWQSNDYQAASRSYEQALAILLKRPDLSVDQVARLDVNEFFATGEISELANTLNDLALVKSSLGFVDEAETLWHQALILGQEVEQPVLVAQIQINLARLLQEQGRLELALDYLNPAVETFTDRNDMYWSSEALSVMGNLYASIGEPATALDYYSEALMMAGEYLPQRAYLFSQMARVNRQLGQPDLADVQFRQSLADFKNSQQPVSQAVVSSLYGLFLYDQGKSQTAIENQREAIKTLSDFGNVREAARAQSRLGLLLINEGQLIAGEQQLEQALAGHRAVSDELFELDTLTALSRAQTGVAALTSAQAATGLAMRIRARTNTENIQTSFVSSRRQAFAQHIELLVETGDFAGAWQVNEQIRARTLLDILPSTEVADSHSPFTIQSAQQALSADTALISYFLSDQRSHLWVLNQNGLTHHSLPPAHQINALSTELAEVLHSQRQSPSRIAYVASQLSDMVLRPAMDNGLQARELIVMADGGLQLVPFGLLPVGTDNPQPLIEQMGVTYSPSARVFSQLSAEPRHPAGKTLVLADPMANFPAPIQDEFAGLPFDLSNMTARRSASQTGIDLLRLPGAQLEAAAIKRLNPQAIVKSGLQASHDFVISSDLREYSTIHFATHGVVDAEMPALSGLVLANDHSSQSIEYLRPQQIAGLELNADLVVLSGCETGLGKSAGSEGLLSLSRSFLAAGAQQVIASLWQVSDRATAQLMERFYFHLLKENQSPEQALRAAQQWMQAQPDWQHPHYWAGFVVQGGHGAG